MLTIMKGKSALPLALMLVFALSRIPGMLPQNFSAAYALAFCAGVYFSGRMAWWLPLSTLLVTDIGLDLYYCYSLGWHVFELPVLKYQLFNYASYVVLIWLGRRFKPSTSFLGLLGGGVLGALLFYLITNTASWLFNPFHNPEYTKNFIGWLTALTKGTSGWPQTWEFFRNTLMSGGIFTGLFVGAMKLTAAAESAKEKEPEEKPAEEPEGEEQPEEANAQTSCSGRTNKSSGGIGLRPKSCPGRLTVLPLPRGEGWGEGEFTLSPTLSAPIPIPHSALCTPHLEGGEFGLTYFPRVRSSEA
jgi:hypothetical protein